MFSKIIDGITSNLNIYYGYDVSSEELDQDFNEPCFFIQLLDTHKSYKLSTRHARGYNFNIRHHNSLDGLDNLNSIGDELLSVLEYIPVGDNIVRGSDMRYEIQDNVLHFFITYNCELEKEKDKSNKMESLITKVGVKIGED